MIYRDDDVNRFTDLYSIMHIQKLFDKYKKVHTVSLVMDGLRENLGIWEWLISAPNIEIALHGWNHVDYSELTYMEVKRDISRSLDYWYSQNIRYPKRKIEVFYPPWNKTSIDFKVACEDCGLRLDVNVDPKETYNFHWWEFIHKKDLKKLKTVLKRK